MNKTFEHDFMEDLIDRAYGNHQYITLEDFLEKYEDYDVEIDYHNNSINVKNAYNHTQYKIEITQIPYED